MSTLIAARQALAEQQIRALRDWLGEDHELLTRARAVAGGAPVVSQVRAVAPPQVHEEVSA